MQDAFPLTLSRFASLCDQGSWIDDQVLKNLRREYKLSEGKKLGLKAVFVWFYYGQLMGDPRQLFFPVGDNYFSPLPFVNEDRDGE